MEGGTGELGLKCFMKRAEYLKHCRKVCFNIYWKANCKIFLVDLFQYTMWLAVVYTASYEEKTMNLPTGVQ